MGFVNAVVPNVSSWAEDEATLIFPKSYIQKEIPLYLKFTCTEYSMNQSARAGGYTPDAELGLGSGQAGGNVKAYIYVPLSPKLVTQTAMRYKQEDNKQIVAGLFQTLAEEEIKIVTGGIIQNIKDLPGINKLPPALKGLVGDASAQAVKAFSSMIETDFTETILQSGSKRSFTISLYLPCLNAEDSEAAAEITRAFEALALPNLISLSATSIPGLGFLGQAATVQLHFHPPMWHFGVTSLNSGGLNTDMDWTSQPQMCVLTNVAVNRTAIDATSFTALDGNLKPLAYSITLNFQEIETAFRVANSTIAGGQGSTSFKIRNRSGAIQEGGISTLFDKGFAENYKPPEQETGG